MSARDDADRRDVDRRVLLFVVGAIAAASMYPIVSPLDGADPAKPQHFGVVAVGVSITYAVLAVLALLDGWSRRHAGRRDG